MSTYETIAVVEPQGHVHLDRVPFEPGTEVEVIIRTKAAADTSGSPGSSAEPRDSLRDLFARARSHNTESVGPLRREELYDRKILR